MVVKGFAEAMSRGEWMVTHQGIAFSSAGVLVDGQHRLAAVIEAEHAIRKLDGTIGEKNSYGHDPHPPRG